MARYRMASPSHFDVVTGNLATIEEILGAETLVVDQHAAKRWELTPGLGDPPPDTRTYQYAVELDDTPDDGPNLVLTISSERSDDYERDKAVLDEMMRRIIISPTPALILDLERLPFCRSELIERTVEGDRYDAAARRCFWEDYEADRPAQMISTFPTVEGTMVREIYRVVGPDEIEWIIDSTHEHSAPDGGTSFAAPRWSGGSMTSSPGPSCSSRRLRHPDPVRPLRASFGRAPGRA